MLMGEQRFDIIFSGELSTGTDAGVARAHLQKRFGLADAALERLFQGRPVSIKRGVDAETAARYRALFQEAGALVRIDPVPEATGVAETAQQPPPTSVEEPASASEQSTLGFSTETGYLEQWPPQSPPDLDLSDLSLAADGWTLEDCAPAPLPVPLPDTSHLSIVEDH